ncbi:HEPN domain-containing protein [Paramicrobacterium fandaimingii]|uniref:HEPN domain-containing protein n=1 Tax=Paramicrobacterium fandaimingii TaxID=2708079 RepID=UPI0014217B6A
MVLTTRDIPFQQLLPMWWDRIEELFPAPQVIIFYHHSSRGLLEQSSASAIAAAEHLHGLIATTLSRFADGYLFARQRELMKTYAGDEFKEFRQFLREKLKEDRPVLGTRLHELLAAITPKQLEKLGLDAAAWIRDVKDVRNKLAHTDAHVPRRSDSGAELERMNTETRALLTLLILSCLGVDEATLDRAADVLGNARVTRA